MMIRLASLSLAALSLLSASLLAASVIIATGASAQSAQGNRQAGRAIAEQHCARCHAIGRKGASPFAKATPFRDIHRKYPVDYLEEAFGEGTTGNHLGMPDFQFTPRATGDLLAYIKSLSNKPATRR